MFIFFLGIVTEQTTISSIITPTILDAEKDENFNGQNELRKIKVRSNIHRYLYEKFAKKKMSNSEVSNQTISKNFGTNLNLTVVIESNELKLLKRLK